MLTSFALKAGYAARIASGATDDFIVSGTTSTLHLIYTPTPK